MDAIRKKMQSLKAETDGLYTTIQVLNIEGRRIIKHPFLSKKIWLKSAQNNVLDGTERRYLLCEKSLFGGLSRDFVVDGDVNAPISEV